MRSRVKREMKEPDDYTVSPNNTHLESSFKVRKDGFEREFKALRE